MNTLTVQPHPTELKPPCTRKKASPSLQVSRLSFTLNNAHEKNLFTANRGDLQCLQCNSSDDNTADGKGQMKR